MAKALYATSPLSQNQKSFPVVPQKKLKFNTPKSLQPQISSRSGKDWGKKQKNFSGTAATIVSLIVVASVFSPFHIQFNGAGASTVTYQNGYLMINGNYVDCDGSLDNDSAHHSTDPSDTDPGHHLGQNCPTETLGGPSPAAAQKTGGIITDTAQAAAPVNTVTYQNGYRIINGNYVDCDGSLDNDSAHHSTDPADTDPGHHLGQNCGGPGQNANAASPPPPPAIAPASPVQPGPSQPAAPNNQNNQSYGASIFTGAKLYYNPSNDATNYANSIRGSDSFNASLLDKIGNQPVATWLGDFSGDVQSTVQKIMAAAQGSLPVLVLYNIPNRDCGGYSAGGGTSDSYKQWVRNVATGIGSGKAVIILEPDATALTDCLSPSDLQMRYSLLRDAVNVFKQKNQAVYIDAGHPDWISPQDMAERLKQSGIAQADGFAVNVSNFFSTSDDLSYGQALSGLLGGKHFVVDTSRNGNGNPPDGQWCNPSGMALGQKPTANTGNPLADAFLWLKYPGESDGSCNGGPSAGTFWPNYGISLANGAHW